MSVLQESPKQSPVGSQGLEGALAGCAKEPREAGRGELQRDCRHPFQVPCSMGSLPSQILSLGACPWMALSPEHPRTPRQEEGADQRAGALTREPEMPSLSASWRSTA